MAEVVGSTASSAIPQETNALLQEVVYELRALQVICAMGMNVTDEIQRIRAEVRTAASSTFTP